MNAFEKALTQRINRKLAHDGKRMWTSRSDGERSNLGARYIVDTASNTVVESRIESLEHFAREIGVMHENEKVAA